nr:uncharacterized protein LOC109427935 [Aedes albopictus]
MLAEGSKKIIGEESASVGAKLIGSLDNFVPSADFDDYMERAENFFELNGITDGTFKRKLIVHYIGLPALRKLNQLLYPKTHKDVTYEVVVTKLKAYFSPKRNRIAQSVDFFKRNQQDFEKVADFAVELQALSKHCEFGDFLDKALRDKFIAGIASAKIQGELMNSDDNSTFEQAVVKAKVLEQIEEDMTKMKVKSGVVNRVNTNAGSYARRDRGRSRERSGYKGRGNSANRGRRDSRPRQGSSKKRSTIRCFNCSRMGHIARFCRFPKERLNSAASVTDDDETSVSSDGSRPRAINHVASQALFHEL